MAFPICSLNSLLAETPPAKIIVWGLYFRAAFMVLNTKTSMTSLLEFVSHLGYKSGSSRNSFCFLSYIKQKFSVRKRKIKNHGFLSSVEGGEWTSDVLLVLLISLDIRCPKRQPFLAISGPPGYLIPGFWLLCQKLLRPHHQSLADYS